MKINIQPLILFEDVDLLALAKPAGMVVMRSQTVKDITIQDLVEEYLVQHKSEVRGEWQQLLPAGFSAEFGTPEEIFQQRQGIAHRLDKDTSGVLLVGKNPGALAALLQQFKTRQVTKEYHCLTHGKFSIPAGTINAPIDRNSRFRLQFAVRSEGRPAVTEYRVEHFWPRLDEERLRAHLHATNQSVTGALSRQLKRYQGFSLVTCWPKTGRTHQIRVHMASTQHPLVGDTLYTGKKRMHLDQLWCPRQLLHAASITFTHPSSGEKKTLTAPLPQDLEQAMTLLSE